MQHNLLHPLLERELIVFRYYRFCRFRAYFEVLFISYHVFVALYYGNHIKLYAPTLLRLFGSYTTGTYYEPKSGSFSTLAKTWKVCNTLGPYEISCSLLAYPSRCLILSSAVGILFRCDFFFWERSYRQICLLRFGSRYIGSPYRTLFSMLSFRLTASLPLSPCMSLPSCG